MWGDKTLTAAAYVKSREQTVRGPQAWLAVGDAVAEFVFRFGVPDVLVVEVPQVYLQKYWKGDPANLIELAGVDGVLASACCATKTVAYLPRQWKGQQSKEAHQPLIEAALTPEETACLPQLPEYIRHNMIDAVGLGLFYFGRISPKRKQQV